MVLSTTTRTSRIQSLTNTNSGGGDRKAGLYPSVAKESWFRIYNKGQCFAMGRCCTARSMNSKISMVNISRPIGYNGNPTYWRNY